MQKLDQKQKLLKTSMVTNTSWQIQR